MTHVRCVWMGHVYLEHSANFFRRIFFLQRNRNYGTIAVHSMHLSFRHSCQRFYLRQYLQINFGPRTLHHFRLTKQKLTYSIGMYQLSHLFDNSSFFSLDFSVLLINSVCFCQSIQLKLSDENLNFVSCPLTSHNCYGIYKFEYGHFSHRTTRQFKKKMPIWNSSSAQRVNALFPLRFNGFMINK